MPIRRYSDFDAWKLCEAFKREVFRLIRGSPEAMRDHKFKSQLIEAARGPAKHIAEGFVRKSPKLFALYLDYAASSLAEAGEHLGDGVQLDYFKAADCTQAFSLRRRSLGACIKLKHSQLRYVKQQTRLKENPRDAESDV